MKTLKNLKCGGKMVPTKKIRQTRPSLKEKKFTFDGALINLGVHKAS